MIVVALLIAVAAVDAQKRDGGKQGKRGKRGRPEMRWESSVVLGVEEARIRNVPIVLHLMSDT